MKNELLGVADPILYVIFTGLWMLADREGRLEDRPLRIKAEICPYRETELSLFNGYLTELASLGFIRRFVVDEIAVIQIVNFHKHQSPHGTEKASVLPPEPKQTKNLQEITVNAPLNNGGLTEQERPDLLIPDSLIPEKEEAASPPTTISNPFQNPAVVLFESKFGFTPTKSFASEVADRVKDLDVWDALIVDKIDYAEKPIKERKRITGWILSAYSERLAKKPKAEYLPSVEEVLRDRAEGMKRENWIMPPKEPIKVVIKPNYNKY